MGSGPVSSRTDIKWVPITIASMMPRKPLELAQITCMKYWLSLFPIAVLVLQSLTSVNDAFAADITSFGAVGSGPNLELLHPRGVRPAKFSRRGLAGPYVTHPFQDLNVFRPPILLHGAPPRFVQSHSKDDELPRGIRVPVRSETRYDMPIPAPGDFLEQTRHFANIFQL